MAITYTGSRGYISAQAKVGAGIIDSVFAGENAIHEPDGWRVFNGWKQIDPARTVPTLAYTATLTNGSNIAALSGGATALTDFRSFQHALTGRRRCYRGRKRAARRAGVSKLCPSVGALCPFWNRA